jgi:hypothetical protein
MIGKEKERCRELCEQAANEYGPQKLQELVVEINPLLEERERQLLQQSISGADPAGWSNARFLSYVEERSSLPLLHCR